MKRSLHQARVRLATITATAAVVLLAPLAAAPAQATPYVPDGMCEAELASLTQQQRDHASARSALATAKDLRASATATYLSSPSADNLAARNSARQSVATAKAAVVTALSARATARAALDACLTIDVHATNFRFDDNFYWSPDTLVADLTFSGLAPNTDYLVSPVWWCGGASVQCADPFSTDSTGTLRIGGLGNAYSEIGWPVASCRTTSSPDQAIYTTAGVLVGTVAVTIPQEACGNSV